MGSIQHVNSSYKYWFSGEGELDAKLETVVLVGIQERLRADFELLKKLLGLPPTLALPEDDVLAHRTPKEFDRRLTPLGERNIRVWYADDLRFYEHCVQIRALRKA